MITCQRGDGDDVPRNEALARSDIGVRRPGRRYAAVAFVGEDAPTLMPLKRNDVLIVNAGKAALKSHATSPRALRHYYDKGVQLYNDHTLHAKVIVSGRRARALRIAVSSGPRAGGMVWITPLISIGRRAQGPEGAQYAA